MEEKVEFKSIKDRIKMFGGQKKSSNNTSSKNPKSDNKNINKYKPKNPATNPKKPENIPKIENTKIIGNYLLEEKGHFKIYKYPKKESAFETSIATKAKKILFLGNAQESFINSFINIYRNIEYKDEFRHKIKIEFKNEKINTDISSFDNTYDNIRITSIPFCKEKNEAYIQNIVLWISKMKIDLICFTFDKNFMVDMTLEQKKEVEFYKYLIHFLDIRDKLIFLCDSKEEPTNEEINKFLDKFNIQKRDEIYEDGKVYPNKIFLMNNEIIYDANNNDDVKKEWEIIKSKIKEIGEIIKKEEMKELNKDEFFNILLKDNKFDIEKHFNKLKTQTNKSMFYFLYFLGEIKFEKDRSIILINLINSMIKAIEDKHKSLNINHTEIEFMDKNYQTIIRALSKISFSNLKNIIFKNCDLYDDNTIFINDLITKNLEKLDLSFNNLAQLNLVFSEKAENLKNLDLSNNNISDLSQFKDSNLVNLTNLNLSNNKLSDINILASNDKFTNLEKLNLNHNQISNVSYLSNSKFSNLIDLDLSFNKIDNIDFIESNEGLIKIEKIDLSDNKIEKLVKISLNNLKYLHLLNNHIVDGIIDFTESISDLSHKLILEKLSDSDSSFKYDYEQNLEIKFNYFIKDDDNINEILKSISFTGIKYLKIKGFDNTNIKYLSNNSLKDLEELDIKENSLTEISIFDNISFPNIKKIIVNENDFNDNSLENLIKNFPSIKAKSISINLQRIHIKYVNPELEINNNNFNIFSYNIGEVDEIKMEEFPNNLEIFSYENFRYKNLPIFNDIKADNLKIKYENEKYSCEFIFKLKNITFKALYDFTNLDFLKSDEILSEITEIYFNNIILDQNINIEKNIAYKNIKNLELTNCIIEDDGIFEQINNKKINNNLKVNSYNTKFKLKKCMNKEIDFITCESSLEKDDKQLNYSQPFYFTIDINVENEFDLIKMANLKSIKTLNFSNAGIYNLDFLTNETLVNLDTLYLNNNKIEDISVFDDNKIHFHKLSSLELKDNPIKEGL